jgi:hypothetical protein
VNITVVLMVLFMLAAIGVAAALAVFAGRRFAKTHQVRPEVATPAGAGWAGAHSPEARLHRRLRDAVAALQASPGLDEAGLFESRVAFEQEALALDEQLATVAALPENGRAEPLAEVAKAVDSLEKAAASLAEAGPALGAATRLDEVIVDVAERPAPVADAQAEVDGGPAATLDAPAVADGPPVTRPDLG